MATQDKQTDPTSKPASVIADERSNNILISGDKAARERLLAVVRQLDVKLPDGGATQVEIGRAQVCTPVTNAHLVCRLLLDKKKLTHTGTEQSKQLRTED